MNVSGLSSNFHFYCNDGCVKTDYTKAQNLWKQLFLIRKWPSLAIFVSNTRRQTLENVTEFAEIWHEGLNHSKIAGKQRKHRIMNDLYTTAPAQIVMYTTEYCSECARAKKFFEANKIPHLRVGLEGNAEATNFVMKINSGYKSVPTIIFPDGSVLVEPDWEELKAKFSKS